MTAIHQENNIRNEDFMHVDMPVFIEDDVIGSFLMVDTEDSDEDILGTLMEPWLPHDSSLLVKHTPLSSMTNLVSWSDLAGEEFLNLPDNDCYENDLPEIVPESPTPPPIQDPDTASQDEIDEDDDDELHNELCAMDPMLVEEEASSSDQVKEESSVSGSSDSDSHSDSSGSFYYHCLSNLARRMQMSETTRLEVIQARRLFPEIYGSLDSGDRTLLGGQRQGAASEYDESRSHLMSYTRNALTEPYTES